MTSRAATRRCLPSSRRAGTSTAVAARPAAVPTGTAAWAPALADGDGGRPHNDAAEVHGGADHRDIEETQLLADPDWHEDATPIVSHQRRGPGTRSTAGALPAVAAQARRRARARRVVRRPMARSSATTGSFSRNGPTSDPGPARRSGSSATTDSPTSTITTAPTALSDGNHQWPPSAELGTTSPTSTPSRSRRQGNPCTTGR